jgi:hypothetical protein
MEPQPSKLLVAGSISSGLLHSSNNLQNSHRYSVYSVFALEPKTPGPLLFGDCDPECRFLASWDSSLRYDLGFLVEVADSVEPQARVQPPSPPLGCRYFVVTGEPNIRSRKCLRDGGPRSTFRSTFDTHLRHRFAIGGNFRHLEAGAG